MERKGFVFVHVELYFCGLVCMIAGNTIVYWASNHIIDEFFCNSDTVLANEADAPTKRKIAANSFWIYRLLVPCQKKKKKRGKACLFEFSIDQSGTGHSFQIWWVFCIKISASEILNYYYMITL